MKGKTIKSQNIRRCNFINPSSSRLHKKYRIPLIKAHIVPKKQQQNVAYSPDKSLTCWPKKGSSSSRTPAEHTHVPRPDLQKEHACKRKPDIKRARIIDPKKG
jgi:hypothetical protein